MKVERNPNVFMSKLCQLCQSIPWFKLSCDLELEPDSFNHYKWPGLKLSSKEGCHLCTIFLYAVRPDWVTETYIGHNSPIQLWLDSESMCIRLKYIVDNLYETAILSYNCFPSRQSWLAQIEKYPVSNKIETTPEVSDCHLAPKVSLAAQSVHTFRIVRYWINNCLHHHSKCVNRRYRSFQRKESSFDLDPELPTRVIDVGLHQVPDEARLLVSEGLRAKYATLSHCWGTTASQAKSTKATLDSYLRGFSVSNLPKTFRDAIQVTRDLGIRYLWIDSLCIVQDSKEDWTFEAANMATVYQHGHINIAATGAKGDDGGCLIARDILAVSPCRLDVSTESGDRETWYVEPLLNDWDSYVARSRWFSRGWTLQEQQLSPRTLHFAINGIYWECDQGLSHESDPLIIRDGEIFGGHETQMFRDQPSWEMQLMSLGDHRFRRPLIDIADCDETESHSRWKLIVINYSTRSLTDENDKLPAISGLAQVFATITNDVYLAGHWNSDLLDTLLWYVEPFSGISTRPDHYRAPSWSRPSIDEGIHFHDPDWTAISDVSDTIVLDITVHTSTSEFLGPITSGKLTLFGDTRPLPLAILDAWISAGRPLTFPLQQTTRLDGIPYEDLSLEELQDGVGEDYDYLPELDDPEILLQPGAILLRVCGNFCLILATVDFPGGKRLYRRVGTWVVDAGNGNKFVKRGLGFERLGWEKKLLTIF